VFINFTSTPSRSSPVASLVVVTLNIPVVSPVVPGVAVVPGRCQPCGIVL
jgi:hypothetical protein